ncbi:hypothetical protein D9758_009703 [Tetrapyrgos nigripes]|uniref:Uncharacterized protein n=1 Tax=Tetrapyrgos nigripes TaxID=182062 RepID=A0A8H5CQH8_9AGAR|nr:hypothetical protein D9758_009703 [Tetrapyrgos nigripes]
MNVARSREVGFISLLIDPMEEVLDDIYNGLESAKYLLYESRNLADWRVAPSRVRNVYIARICRALCLLGYNIGSAPLRDKILACITSLRIEGHVHPLMYSRYVQADSWDALSVVVRRSMTGNEMDEMVQLLHRSRIPTQVQPIAGVRQIVYDRVSDIPGILVDSASRMQHTLVPGRSRLNPSAASFVPLIASLAGAEESKEDETDNEQVEDVEAQELPTAALPVGEEPEILEPTELEHRIASFIQTKYRSRMSARKAAKGRYAQIRDSFWHQCLEQLADILPSGVYRKMLLGPLPHIWAVLEYMNVQTLELKHSTRKRMGLKVVLNPEEWDRLDKQLTRISTAFKKLKNFQTSIAVQSDVHRKQDHLQLKQLIRDLDKFIQEDLPFELPADMQKEYAIGYKYIVKEPAAKTIQRPVKPELNTSDCYE